MIGVAIVAGLATQTVSVAIPVVIFNHANAGRFREAAVLVLESLAVLLRHRPFQQKNQKHVGILVLEIGLLRLWVDDRLALVELQPLQPVDSPTPSLELQ